MARPIFYSPAGEIFRISPFSSSQIRQLLAAGRHDQIDAVEEEFFEELLFDLKKLLGNRISSGPTSNGRRDSMEDSSNSRVVPLSPSGALVIQYGSRSIGADKDGLIWLRQVFAGRLSFVLDAGGGRSDR